LVYLTGHDFSSWNRYANYLFMGVLLFALVGTFAGPLGIIAFALALLGFIVYLVYEIWNLRQRPSNVLLNGVGIYVAVMGVFVEILRLVVAMYLEE
ncbi:MAG: hypothetical protein ABEJ72_10640, partial [Candidatus Aenigmatarchaeota archaeon]